MGAEPIQKDAFAIAVGAARPSSAPWKATASPSSFVLTRLLLPRRDRAAPFDMPPLKEAADCRDVFAAIVAADGGG